MEDVENFDDNLSEISEMVSESALSQHSFEEFELIPQKESRYTTTNLITQANLTLADIQIEQLNK